MDTVKSSVSAAATTAKRTLTSAPPADAYLPWNAPGVETIKDDEEGKAVKIADTMNKMQRHNFDQVIGTLECSQSKTYPLRPGCSIHNSIVTASEPPTSKRKPSSKAT